MFEESSNPLSDQSWQRHVQLRSAIGAILELSKPRHIERYPRVLIRNHIETLITCLNDIDSYEDEPNKERGIK
jgi:hypothetical protein